jgi:tetratricopeptide (TPR) repeat protein
MGLVYRASDTVLERPVAVKGLSKVDPSGEKRSSLLDEARAAARLNHPNIVTVYDASEYHGVPFIVMELVQGQTLREMARPSLDEALRIARDVCAALDHAHQNDVIHRDVKPENVILSQGGTAKLMDFGLARDSTRSRLTDGGTLKGTLAYLAPELILGQPASPQSDLYALGMVLYEMTAGRSPFEGDNPAVLLTNHLHAPVIPPSAHNVNITPALDDLIIHLLEKETTRRPSTAASVLEWLARIADPASAGVDSAVPTTIPEAPAAPLLNRIARGRLVGREQELTQATQLWSRSLSGQAGLLLISGEPGIGKTRLAQAIIAQARLGGASFLSGGCYEFEATTPYLPMVEALHDWIQDHDAEMLKTLLGPTASELARLAPEIETILGPLPSNPTLGQEEQRLRLFENLAQFLNKLADENGLLFFIDDLHWADQGTLNLLSYLLRRFHRGRLLIIGTYREVELDRSHPLADALVQWNRQRLVERLQLARFTVAETNSMIATLFGQVQVSDEFAEAIHRETEGNPFFIEEVAKALVEQGQIYWIGDRWERDALEELAIPQSIKETIGRRLNRLGQSCIDILHTASVIGKDFSYALLAAVSSEDEDQLLDALDEAVAAQLIRPASSSLNGETFIFTHDKIREVLYDEILTVRRHRLHQRVALALESGEAGEDTERVEDLAYHFIAAGVLDKGLAFARRAAENAQNLFAHDEALQYYRQAYECAVTLGDSAAQIDILEAMGGIYSSTGPLPVAVEQYEAALALLSTPEESAPIKVKIGLVYNQINDERGIALLEEVLEDLDPDEHPLDVGGALVTLGRFRHYRGEYSTAIELYQRAFQLTESFVDSPVHFFIYGGIAGSYQHMADMDQSMAWARAAVTLGEEHNNPQAVAMGYEFIAENYLVMGVWDRALESARKDRQIGEKIGSMVRMGWGQWCTSHALWGKGALEQALEECKRALEVATTIGENRLAVLTHTTFAFIFTDLGNETAAFEHLAQAQEGVQRMVEVFQQGYMRQAAGYVHLQHGDWQRAIELYELAFEGLAKTENRDIFLEGYPYYAEVLLQLGRAEEAAVIIDRSLQLSQEVGAVHYEAVTHRVYGQLLSTQDDFASAAAAFEKGLSLTTESNSQIARGRIHFHRARMHHLQGDLEQVRADTIQAQTIFADCQAGRDLSKTQELLKLLA